MITQRPSELRKRFEGTMPASVVPAGPRVTPRRSYSGTTLSSIAKQASVRATSTTWPRPAPAPSRQTSASRMPWSAKREASESPSEMPRRGGGRSGKPFRCRRPAAASATDAKPARCDCGPVCP